MKIERFLNFYFGGGCKIPQRTQDLQGKDRYKLHFTTWDAIAVLWAFPTRRLPHISGKEARCYFKEVGGKP